MSSGSRRGGARVEPQRLQTDDKLAFFKDNIQDQEEDYDPAMYYYNRHDQEGAPNPSAPNMAQMQHPYSQAGYAGSGHLKGQLPPGLPVAVPVVPNYQQPQPNPQMRYGNGYNNQPMSGGFRPMMNPSMPSHLPPPTSLGGRGIPAGRGVLRQPQAAPAPGIDPSSIPHNFGPPSNVVESELVKQSSGPYAPQVGSKMDSGNDMIHNLASNADFPSLGGISGQMRSSNNSSRDDFPALGSSGNEFPPLSHTESRKPEPPVDTSSPAQHYPHFNTKSSLQNPTGLPGGHVRKTPLPQQPQPQPQPSEPTHPIQRPPVGMTTAPQQPFVKQAPAPQQAPAANPPDRYSLLGLLSVIRMSDPDLNTLALGTDLTTLGLNLNSPDCLYATFASPWADQPSRREPEYYLPPCYYMQPPLQAPQAKLGLFSDETLFYIFYSMTKDNLQLVAAQELYSRDWRYHKEHKLWFTRVPGSDPLVKTPTYERGSYIYFDTTSWEKVRKDNFVLQYDQLEKMAN